MSLRRKTIGDLVIGTLSSSIFCWLLVTQIMAGGVGDSITFSQFLSYPENILFCLVVSMFIFASWLMRGLNNRVVLFCWTIMYTLNFMIFSTVYEHYYDDNNRNTYMLLLAGIVAYIPGVIVIRYRVFITTFILVPVGKAGILSKQIVHYLRNANATDFEVNMKMMLYVSFTVEFLYSLYMIIYCFSVNLPHYASVTAYLEQNNAWNPIDLYYWLLNMVTIGYILIIGFYIYRDNTHPDTYLHGFSSEERQQASLKVLEKYRKQAEEKQKKKRD